MYIHVYVTSYAVNKYSIFLRSLLLKYCLFALVQASDFQFSYPQPNSLLYHSFEIKALNWGNSPKWVMYAITSWKEHASWLGHSFKCVKRELIKIKKEIFHQGSKNTLGPNSISEDKKSTILKPKSFHLGTKELTFYWITHKMSCFHK